MGQPHLRVHELDAFEGLPRDALDLVQGKAIVPVAFDELVQALTKGLKDHAGVLRAVLDDLVVAPVVSGMPFIMIFFVSKALVHVNEVVGSASAFLHVIEDVDFDFG